MTEPARLLPASGPRPAAGRTARGRAVAALAGLASCVALAAAGLPDAPRFASEIVRLRVSGGVQTVEGTYFFTAGDGGGRAAILYPFPEDPRLGVARVLDSRIAHGAAPEETLLTWGQPRGVGWSMTLAPHETCRVFIRYSQPLRDTHACYLLTTARGWGRPLDRARLEVTLPATARRPRFSLPFRRAGCDTTSCTWVCERARFLPAKELVVDWQEPGP